MKRKYWVHLLAVVLIVVLAAGLSVTVFADDGNSGGTVSIDGLTASKYVTVREDGTYDITLDAFSTGEVKTETVTVPADIILVLDVSGSMEDPMSYSYSARSSQGYSCNDIYYSSYYFNSDHLYYKHTDDNYYEVQIGENNRRYYLFYSTGNNTYYLSGTEVSTTRPTGTDFYSTAWTGVLYARVAGDSKMDALKAAVNGFIDEVAKKNKEAVDAGAGTNDLSRIAIVKFAGSRRVNDYSQYKNYMGNETYGNYDYNYTQVVRDLGVVTQGEVATNWKQQVNAFGEAGATSADYGMGYANAIISAHSTDHNYTDPDKADYRSRVVVMFTDGEPNHQSGFDGTVANDAITYAKSMKDNGVVVYSIAVYAGADPSVDPPTTNINKYLHGISSNYPAATAYTALGTRGAGNYYYAAESADQLAAIFKEIGQSSGSTTSEVSSEAVMKDIVSSAFTLPAGADDSNIDVTVVRWNTTTRTWGTGADYVFTPAQWAEKSTDYGAETPENIEIKITDGKTVDITGFDYQTHYKATSDEQDADNTFDQSKVNKYTAKIHVTFHIFAKPSAVTGGSVATNGENSGIYLNDDPDTTPTITFPQPKVVFTPVTYVVDYVTSDTSTDTKASTIRLDYYNVLNNVQMLDDPSDDVLIGEKAVDFDYTIYKGKYGTISFGDDELDVQRRYVRYAPTTMNWDDYDRIFIKGESATGNEKDVWAMLAVVPANSVFYEDTYISQTKTVEYGKDPETGKPYEVTIEYTGIAYTGEWGTVGMEGKNQTQHADKDDDGNPIPQGWIDGLVDDSDYANDMAHISSTAKAKASFTFSGTGVDIYSRTNGSTGTILVSLKSAANENASGNKVAKTKIIDTKAAAGDFYAVPVCTFTDLAYGKYTVTITVTSSAQKEGRMTFYLDGVRVYNPIQPHEDEANIISMYGEENLGAVFTEVRSLLGTGATAAALYIDEKTTGKEVTDLDAIEAAAQALAAAQAEYDEYVEANVTPAKNNVSNAEFALQNAKDKVTNTKNIYDAAKKAYDNADAAGASEERIAELETAMNTAETNWVNAKADLVTAQAKYDAEIDGLQDALDNAIAGKAPYVAAIDAARDAYDVANEAVDVEYITENVVEDYNKDGPKSELYLSKGQQVAINVESGKYYYIGLRSLNGDKVTCTINGAATELSHTVDLYYEATPTGDSIVIKNTGDAILAITKLRTTGTGNTTNGTKMMSTEATLAYVNSMSSMSVVDYTGEVLTEEEATATEPVVEEPVAEEPEVAEEVLDENEIVIDNPEPEVTETEEQNEAAPEESEMTKILSSFFNFFRRR